MKKLNELGSWEDAINEVVHGDCFDVMAKMPDGCINLLICDPPYFEVKGNFDFTFKDFNEYKDLMRKLAKEFKRILSKNGSLFVFGHAKKIAYKQIIFDEFFNLENSLVWYKYDAQTKRGVDEFRSFAPVTERILFYSNEVEKTGLEEIKDSFGKEITTFGKIIEQKKEEKGLTNKDIAKLFPSRSGGLTGCVSNWIQGQNIPTKEQWQKICDLLDIENEYEHLRQEYEHLRQEYEHLRQEYEHLRRPFNNILKLSDVIKFSQEANVTGKWKHPTQKPPKLIEALIQTCSREGDLVFDPMGGSFSTARACADTGRDWISCDMDEEYCEIGEQRLKQQNLF